MVSTQTPAESATTSHERRAAERLDRIAPDLVSDRLRAAVLAGARAAGRQADLQERRQAADDRVDAARSDPTVDLDELRQLADLAASWHRLDGMVLAGRSDVPPDVATEAAARVQVLLAQASSGTELRQPAYVLEHAEWAALPSHFRADPRVTPPTATRADIAAHEKYLDTLALLQDWQRTVAAVRAILERPGIDIVGILETVTSLVASRTTIPIDDSNIHAAAADAERERLGLTWKVPAL